jgi:hypothetical protein
MFKLVCEIFNLAALAEVGINILITTQIAW